MNARRQPLATLFALGLMLALPLRAAEPLATAPARFQEAIDAFQAADRAQPLPQGGILFVGAASSGSGRP